MYEADKQAADTGVATLTLMENAGAAVAAIIVERFSPQPIVVLCGPGNNGGDGFVVARLLKEKGFAVKLALACDAKQLQGDSAMMASRWEGEVLPLTPIILDGAKLVVDALFGIGLSRAIEGEVATVIESVNRRRLTVIAVDIPSGVNGDTGNVLGPVIQAALTVTFCRKKPGHVLLPGRDYAGEVVVAPIGIPESIFTGMDCTLEENNPASWREAFPFPTPGQHKYKRGHVIVRGGGRQATGAASMAAHAALRVGAGLVTIACSEDALPIYASRFMSVMTEVISEEHTFADILEDPRKNVALIGPGNGVDGATRDALLAALQARKSCVVDADALTAFAGEPWELFKAIHSPTVLTPHEGEFQRLFPTLADKPSKIVRAREAAAISNAVIILKGSDTVIAHPDGRVAINTNAPPWLATAGSGDVLSGIVAGILANGVELFTAVCMAVWLHGEAANIAGIGMIAEELPDYLPLVLGMVYNHKAN